MKFLQKYSFLTNFDSIIKAHARKTHDFFFVQIGANDGITRDPIHKYVDKYGWSGVLVEPQKDMIEKARASYANKDNLIFENVAITPTDGLVELYVPKNPKISGCATITPGKHRRMGIYKKNNLLEIRKVQGISLDTLVKKHDIKKIDLLQIDAEGYDFEIIKSINFDKIKPIVINYERKHLSSNDRKECVELLESNGYIVPKGYFSLKGDDTVAFLTSFFEVKAVIVKC